MDDNIKKLHQALIDDGYDDVGTEQEFRDYVSDSKNVATLYNALSEAEYDNFKDQKSLETYLSAKAPVAQKPSTPQSSGQSVSSKEKKQTQYPQEVIDAFNSPDNKPGNFKDLAQLNDEYQRGELKKPILISQALGMMPKVDAGNIGRDQKVGGMIANLLLGDNMQVQQPAQKEASPESKEAAPVTTPTGVVNNEGLMDAKLANYIENWKLRPDKQSSYFENMVADLLADGTANSNEEAVNMVMPALHRYANRSAMDVTNQVVSSLPDDTVQDAEQSIGAQWYSHGVQDKLKQEADSMGISYDDYVAHFLKPAMVQSLVNKYGPNYRDIAEGIATRLYSHDENVQDRLMNQDINDALSDVISKYTSTSVAKAIQDAEAASNAQMAKYNEQSKYVDAASPFAIGAIAEANKTRDPQKILGDLQKKFGKLYRNPEFLNDMSNAAFKVMQRYGLNGTLNGDPKQFKPMINAAIKNELDQLEVKGMIPRGSADYILKTGIENTIIGKVSRKIMQTDYQNWLEDIANQQYQPGFWENVASGALTFAGDAWSYWLPGAAGGKLTKSMVAKAEGRLAGDLMAKGMERKMAERAAKVLIGKSKAEALKSGAVHGAVTFGGQSAISKPIDEVYRTGQFDENGKIYNPSVGKVIADTLGEVAKQSAVGAIMQGGTIANMVGKGRGLATNILADVGGKVADSGIMTGHQMLERMAQDPNFKPTGKDAAESFLESMANLTAIGLPGMVGKYARFKDAREFNKKFDFTDQDIAELKRFGYDGLRDAFEKVGIGEYAVVGENAQRLDGQLTQKYMDLMNDKSVPEVLKAKMMAVVEGKRPSSFSPVVDSVIVQPMDHDGKVYLETLNKDGGIIDRKEFSSLDEAQKADKKLEYEKTLGLASVLEGEFHNEFTQEHLEGLYNKAAQKYNMGEKLTDEDKAAVYLHQNAGAIKEIMDKQQKGVILTDEEQKQVDTYRHFYNSALENSSVMREFVNTFEDSHGVARGTLRKALESKDKKFAPLVESYLKELYNSIELKREMKQTMDDLYNTAHGNEQKRIEGENPVSPVEGSSESSAGGQEPPVSEEPAPYQDRTNSVPTLSDAEVVANPAAEGAGNEPKVANSDAFVMGQNAYKNGDSEALQAIGYNSDLATGRLQRAFADNEKMPDIVANAYNEGRDMEQFMAQRASSLTPAQKEAISKYVEAMDAKKGAIDALQHADDGYGEALKQQLWPYQTEDGNIVPATLDSGKQVFLKKDNEYGGAFVVVPDEQGLPTIKQVSKASIIEKGTPVPLDEYIEKAVAQQKDARNKQFISQFDATSLNPNDTVSLSINDKDQPTEAKIVSVNPDGTISFNIAGSKNVTTVPVDTFNKFQKYALRNSINAELDAEDAERDQKAVSQAEADKKQRYANGIVGLSEGQPDYSSKDTDPNVAAEYLQEQFGEDHGKLLNLINGSRDDIKTQLDNKKKAAAEYRDWLDVNADLDPEKAQKVENDLALVNEQIADLDARFKNWNAIRNSVMTPDEVKAMKEERKAEIEKAGVDKSSVLPDVDTGVRIPENSELKDKYPTQEAASGYITSERRRVYKMQEETQREIDGVDKILNQYMDGDMELSAEQLRDLNTTKAELANRQNALTADAKALKGKAESLNILYIKERAEQNKKNLEALSPKDRRKELVAKALEKKDMKAIKEIYKDASTDVMDLTPRTLEEFVSERLFPHSLNAESLAQELGSSNFRRGIGSKYDTNKFNYLLANNGEGLTISELAKRVWEDLSSTMESGDGDGLQSMYTDQDIRNTILDMFKTYDSVREMRNVTLLNRIAAAENELSGEEEWYEQQKEREIYEKQAEIDEYKSYIHDKELSLPSESELDHIYGLEYDRMMEIEDREREYKQYVKSILPELADYDDRSNEEGYGGGSSLGSDSSRRGVDEGNSQGEEVGNGEASSKSEIREGSDSGRKGRQETGSMEPGEGSAVRGSHLPQEASFGERLKSAIAETETEPTEAQKKAGNYKKGHLSFGGYDYTVETPKGVTRSGKDEHGKPWSVTMHDTYGYILGKIGVDGDHIDMFINDDADLDSFDGNVCVVDQVNPETGEFDEHKVMYGYPDEAAAITAYAKNYSPGWKGLGKVTSVPKSTFDKWLESSDRKTKPFREYAMIQNEEAKKAKEEGEMLGFPAIDKEGEPINNHIIELVKWAKEQGLEIDPTSKLNSYADLFVMCKDDFGIYTLVPDEGEDINQVVYFPDSAQVIDQLGKLQEEFNAGRDLKHSSNIDSELTEGVTFYDADTAREFKDFVNKKLEKQNKFHNKLNSKTIEVPEDATEENPLGSQLDQTNLPFHRDVKEVKPSEMTEAQKVAYDAVSTMLKKAGIPVKVVSNEDMEKVAEAQGKGVVYGYTDGKQIVLNQEHLNPNTPIHEYQHLWRTAAKEMNPELIEHGDKLIMQTQLFADLKLDPNYNHLTDEQICDEAFARLTGEDGAAILEQMAKDAIKENPLDTAKELSVINKLKEWLKKFWYWTLDTFTKWKPEDIKKMTLEDIRNLVLRDLANGVDPRNVLNEKKAKKDDKTLAGVHNITEEKLRKALKLGGLANPSLAVIDTNKSAHDNFGEISFIAPSALVDKRTGKTGGTWITDAYTQRYPSVEREMSEKGSQKFEDWVDSLEYPSAAKAEIKRQTKDVLEDNGVPAWELMYLKEKGIDIKAYDSNVDYRWKEIINKYPTVDDILNSMQNDPELNEDVTSLAKYQIVKPTRDKISLEVRRQIYKETGVKTAPISPKVRNKVNEIFERDYASTLLDKDGKPKAEDVKKVVEQMVKEHNDTKKYDFYLSKVKARNYVHKNGLYADYIRWQENKLDEFGTKNRIFRGYKKDGSRKYVPETLDNVSKVMREDADGQTNGGEYTSFGSFIAKLASRVDSTGEMRANKDKLSSNKDKEEFYEKWKDVYYDLSKTLYNDVFYGEQRLHDIVSQPDPKKYAKKEYGITLTPSFMKKLDSLKNAVQNDLKSAYFETKFNRPVHLNEFVAAVVPNDLGEDVRKGLEESGLSLFDYDPEKEGDRSRAFNEAINSNNQIRFHRVTEPEELERLNKEKTFRMYSGMQELDGKLYSPMAAIIDGKRTDATEIGAWMRADERPDLVKGGKFQLVKTDKNPGAGEGPVRAAYNPYMHTSTSMMNDQFTGAYARGNIKVVEWEIPESEKTSGYRAEGAKDAVGLVPWHSGSVNGLLPKDRQRSVMLSRWRKAVRVVPDSEVAESIAKQLEGTGLAIPWNVVTPNQLRELVKLGVPITTEESGQQAPETKEKFMAQMDELKKEFPQAQFVDVKMTKDAYKEWGVLKFSLGDNGTDVADGNGDSMNKNPNKDVITRRIGSRAQAQRRVNETLGAAAADFRRDQTATTEKQQGTWDRGPVLGYVIRAAKKNLSFIPDEELKKIVGDSIGHGEENFVYHAKYDDTKVIKLNDFTMTDGLFRINEFIDRINAHNQFMPEDKYTPLGFAYNQKGDPCIVMEQPYLKGTTPTREEITQYLTDHGFKLDMIQISADEVDLGWTNGEFDLWDAEPRNVIKDENGDLHFFDTMIQHTTIPNHKNPLRLSMPSIRTFESQEMKKSADKVKNVANVLGGAEAVTYTSSADVPEEYRVAIEQGAKGWYDPTTHTVHVYLPNCADANEAERTVLHEKIGHEGMEVLLGGEDGVRKFANFVYRSVGKDVRGKIIDFANKYDPDWKNPDRMNVGTQEYIARLAEEGPKSAEDFTLWTKIKHYLIRLLKKLGIRVPGLLNDKDLRYYLMKAGKALHVWDNMPKEKQEAMMKQANNAEIKDALSDGANLPSEEDNKPKKKTERGRIDEATGAFKLAPNGEQSNLSKKQYIEARTKNFKDWFGGDWEKKPKDFKNKLDANGEPLEKYVEGYLNRPKKPTMPKKRKGEDEATFFGRKMLYSQALEDWPKTEADWKKRIDEFDENTLAALTPPDEEAIREKYQKQYENDMASWRKDHPKIKEGEERPLKIPDMRDYQSIQDYGEALGKHEIWKTAPNKDEYERMAEDEIISKVGLMDAVQHPFSEYARLKTMKAEFQHMRHVMQNQKVYDQNTTDAVVQFAKRFMSLGYGDDLGRGSINTLLTIVKNSTGKKSYEISQHLYQVMDVLMNNQLRNFDRAVMKTMSIKELKENAKGIQVQGKLELRGQTTIKAFRDAVSSRISSDKLDEKISNLIDKMATDKKNASSYQDELLGLNLAKQYVDYIDSSRNDAIEIEDMKRMEIEGYKNRKGIYEGELTKALLQEHVERLNQYDDALFNNKVERMERYSQLLANLGGMIDESVKGAREFQERDARRAIKVKMMASADLGGKSMNQHHKENWKTRLSNSDVVRLFCSPLGSFDALMREFGSKQINGEGQLWNHFVRGAMKASNDAFKSVREANNEIDLKVSELFGKVTEDKNGNKKGNMILNDLYALERSNKVKSLDVTIRDIEGEQTYKLQQGNLMYIYMVNKMPDGAMKLRQMGILDADVERIKENIDPRFLKLADWIQGEFLPKMRTKYNKRHEELFGAPMPIVENYFPLRVLKNARYMEEDVNNTSDGSNALPSTATGAIIKRKINKLPLDILNADALSVTIDNIKEMENWYNYAPIRKDANTLLSDTAFRNRVQNMTTIYGSGERLWNNVKDATAVAMGTYRPKGGTDLAISLKNFGKGITGAKISFRLYTAFKQVLSAPMFLPDVDLGRFVRHFVHPYGSFKWAIENLPNFDKRWSGRKLGDTVLMDDPTDWKLWHTNLMEKAAYYGMTPNALVDAVTCAVGARAVYDTKYKQYIKYGLTEERAKEKALSDAEINFNTSQQSSEGAFVSPMQLDRTLESAIFTPFRNSSMLYERKGINALRNLKHRFEKGHKEASIKFMAGQLMEEGVGYEQATKAAEKMYQKGLMHNIADAIVSLWLGAIIWNLGGNLGYLMFGDDNEKKKKMVLDAVILGLLEGPVDGLAGGQFINTAIANTITSDGINLKGLKNVDLSGMPMLSDFNSMIEKFGYDKVAGAQDLMFIVMQSATGFNPKTLTDAINACIDYGNGDMTNAKEIALFVFRLMNGPAATVDNLYIDELGMKGKDAKKLSYEELAKRYAEYKFGKNTFGLGKLYSDEEKQKKLKAIEKSFDKKVSERLAGMDREDLKNEFSESRSQKEKKLIGKIIADELETKDSEAVKKAKADASYLRQRNFSDLMDDLYLQKEWEATNEANAGLEELKGNGASEKEIEAYETKHKADLDKRKAIQKARKEMQKKKADISSDNDEATMAAIRKLRDSILKTVRQKEK